MSTPAAAPATVAPHALPVGQRLGEFEIRAVIGVGGFGIVYHAFDHALERDVAIKEYMPGALAARSATLHVSVLSQGHAETFALGLKSFVNEARLLARFDHPSLVKVHRFWEANGTAYMVMPLYRGRTLKALRQALGASPDEDWLRSLLAPLLGALEALHAEGVYHRDIAPDNILVGDDGRPVLLDFGAARRVISDRSQTLTAILKPSYAPIEQYAEAEGLRQGPWTDLYALGATLCFAVTGVAPQPATARALGTDHHRLAALPRLGVSTAFLQLIDWMMAPRPEHRPQSVAELREVLEGRAAAPVPPAPAASSPSTATAWERTAVQPGAVRGTTVHTTSTDAAAPRRPALRWAVAAAAVVVAGVAVAAWRLGASTRQDEPAAAVARASTAVATEPLASTPPASPPPTTLPVAQPAEQPALPPAPAASPVETARAIATPVVPHARTATVRRDAAPNDPPGPAAAPPAASEPEAPAPSPHEQCDGRHLLALHRCLKRVCQAPEWANHRDCRRMRQVEAAAATRTEH